MYTGFIKFKGAIAMSLMDTATKVTQQINREDGSQVRIIAQEVYDISLNASVVVMVHRRSSADQPWSLCSDRPHPKWREMSVDEYCEHGRSEALQAASTGEILRVAGLLGKPLNHEAFAQ